MSESRLRIIVVDDDARLRELLNRYLSEQGFSVRAVADGNDMNRWLARERYDLMVLDLMMPGEDGLSICRRLRGLGDKIPIITSGYGRSESADGGVFKWNFPLVGTYWVAADILTQHAQTQPDKLAVV
ncbi:MAG: response regulator, partial [Pseudomonadota bacterium]